MSPSELYWTAKEQRERKENQKNHSNYFFIFGLFGTLLGLIRLNFDHEKHIVSASARRTLMDRILDW